VNLNTNYCCSLLHVLRYVVFISFIVIQLELSVHHFTASVIYRLAYLFLYIVYFASSAATSYMNMNIFFDIVYVTFIFVIGTYTIIFSRASRKVDKTN